MLSFLQQGQSGGSDPLPQMPDYSQISLPAPPQPQQRQGGGFGDVLKELTGNTLSGVVSKYVGNKLQTYIDDQTAKEQGDALGPVIDEQIAGMDKNNPFRAALASTRKLVTSGSPNTVKFGMKRYDDISKSMVTSANPEVKNHLQIQPDEHGNIFYIDTANGGEPQPVMYKGTQLRNPQYSTSAISQRTTAAENQKIVPFTDSTGHPGFAPQGQLTGAAPQGQPTQGPSANNQGNIRPVGSNTGYQQFNTPEEGIAAMDKQLKIFGSEHGVDTLAKAITRWAPPGGKDNNDTPALIANASRMLGIGPNDKIDLSNPATRAMLSAAIIRQESGNWKKPPTQSPSGPVRGQSATEQAAATAEVLMPYKQQEQAANAQIDIQKENIKNTNKIQTDLTKTNLEQQAAASSPERVKGRTEFSKLLTDLNGYYDELDKINGAHNSNKGVISNTAASFNTSELGQKLGRAVGSRDQVLRDKIETAKTTLMPLAMKATGMVSQQLNSEMELQNFLKTLTSPDVDVSVAKEQIKRLENLHGVSSVKGAEPLTSKEPPHPGYSGTEKMVGGVKYKKRNDGKWEGG
jgi:hypothetical protein